MKRILSLFILCVFLISLLNIAAIVCNAEYAERSYGADSSFDDSFIGNVIVRSVTKSEFSIFNVILIVLAALSALAAFAVFRIKLSRQARNTKKLISMLERKDSAWKYQTICEQARNTYFAVHKILVSADMSCASEYMSEKFFTEFREKLSLPKMNNNASDIIRLKEIVPVAVHDDTDDRFDCVWFYINGNSTNCSIDTVINEQLTKKSRETAESGEYWQFVRGGKGWMLNKILQANEKDKITFIG